MSRVIYFYGKDNPYGYYSNFSPHAIFVENKIWPTVEHYYQAKKFSDEGLQEYIRRLSTPGKAKREGNEPHPEYKANWPELKDDVMRVGIYHKFTQHPDLNEKLIIEDGDADLFEHTENDKYWGDGGDGSGKNMLGKLLMELRNKLRMEDIFG